MGNQTLFGLKPEYIPSSWKKYSLCEKEVLFQPVGYHIVNSLLLAPALICSFLIQNQVSSVNVGLVDFNLHCVRHLRLI